ncbi:LytTR family DNA-binding domain-containing protein [Rheinheimera fenheensis]|uniref:LytTR family DNA-binding domain-containing protein n=1 Tax=Rheinheimera fenheensis TaxID=3152295 RepID=UPI00325F805C
MTKPTTITLTERLIRQPRRYGYALLGVFLLINALVNASSVWTDLQRRTVNDILWWEPLVWELSSAVSVLFLCPLLFYWFAVKPLKLTDLRSQLLQHLLATLLFAVLHIILMVLLRLPVYHLAGMEYGFAPLTEDFWYEYRKDAWAYVFFLCCYTFARHFYSRISGEAHVLAQGDTAAITPTESEVTAPEYYLVKKLDREFLLRTADIEWLEASGNYVNLHSGGRIYPLRATLSATLKQLSPLGFCRCHRSLAVNLHQIASMQFQSSGDGEITLKNGAQLNLSRRYKEELKQRLAPV